MYHEDFGTGKEKTDGRASVGMETEMVVKYGALDSGLAALYISLQMIRQPWAFIYNPLHGKWPVMVVLCQLKSKIVR